MKSKLEKMKTRGDVKQALPLSPLSPLAASPNITVNKLTNSMSLRLSDRFSREFEKSKLNENDIKDLLQEILHKR